MTWQYIIIAISALMLFGFVAIGVIKFGWLSCYSAYGPEWGKWFPKLNVWSIVTALSALLMVPVLLENSAGNPWQFLGFLAPVSLGLVAASPNYQEGGFYNIMHQVGAWGGVVFIVSYILTLKNPMLFWIVGGMCLAALIATLITGWKKWMFWFEMAVYAMIFVIMFTIIKV